MPRSHAAIKAFRTDAAAHHLDCEVPARRNAENFIRKRHDSGKHHCRQHVEKRAAMSFPKHFRHDRPANCSNQASRQGSHAFGPAWAERHLA